MKLATQRKISAGVAVIAFVVLFLLSAEGVPLLGVNISRPAGVTALLASLAVIVIPRVARSKVAYALMLSAVAAILVSAQILLTRDGTIDLDWGVLSVEMVIIATVTWLIRLYVKEADNGDRTDGQISKTGTRRLPSDAKAILDYEFVRARRYTRPLSIILLESDRPRSDTGDDGKREPASNSQPASALLNVLRRTERVLASDDQGRSLIICPETTLDQAKILVDRLNLAIASGVAGISKVSAVASFPEDGLTLEAILRCAENRLPNKPRLLKHQKRSEYKDSYMRDL